ncbi:LAFA_0E20362g1_1 [Lachancea sp. 'fantastica']|nr:LAFA_0E20362g1_1 [Lachancea sp. 'fantastica']
MDFDQFMSFQQKPGGETDKFQQTTSDEISYGGSVDNRASRGRNSPLSVNTELKKPPRPVQGTPGELENLFFSPVSDEIPDGYPLSSNMTTPTIKIEQPFDDHTNFELPPSTETHPSMGSGFEDPIHRPFLASQQQQQQQHLPSAYHMDYGPSTSYQKPSALLSPNAFDDSISTHSSSLHSAHSPSSFSDHLTSEWLPHNVALSPASSRLTTGDDELDEILSVNSANEPFYDADFDPIVDSHSTQQVEAFSGSIDDVFGDSQLQLERDSPAAIRSDFSNAEFLKPHISIEEFKSFSPNDLLHNKVLSSTSSPVSFHTARQNTDFLSVQTDEGAAFSEENSDTHTLMRQGRKIRRQSIQVGGRSTSSRRRLSVDEKARSLSEDREKLLELAALKPSKSQNDYADYNGDFDPSNLDDDDPIESSERKRNQKNLAIYACHVCDKKFTRPYNLKSHLRTHTDERPFVCSICGKAFARQHDRKRHEDLHTGKKRYVCQGKLKNGSQWGCGKKFARSDALGRHLKTEGGKRCIAPLYEEVTRERAAGRKADFDLPIDF